MKAVTSPATTNSASHPQILASLTTFGSSTSGAGRVPDSARPNFSMRQATNLGIRRCRPMPTRDTSNNVSTLLRTASAVLASATTSAYLVPHFVSTVVGTSATKKAMNPAKSSSTFSSRSFPLYAIRHAPSPAKPATNAPRTGVWKYALTEPRTQTSPRVVSKAVETTRMSRSGIMASRSDR